jgi:hypothetical protein
MTTKSLTLNVPVSLALELDKVSRDSLTEILERGLRQWRIEKALKRYAAREMSFGAAADQAGISQSELSRQAYARGLEAPFSAKTLREELS